MTPRIPEALELASENREMANQVIGLKAQVEEFQSKNRGLHGTIAEMDSEIYGFNKVNKRLCKDREGLEADNLRIVKANVDLSNKIEKLESDFNATCSTIEHQGGVIRDQQEKIFLSMRFCRKDGHLDPVEIFSELANRGARIAELEGEIDRLREEDRVVDTPVPETPVELTEVCLGIDGTPKPLLSLDREIWKELNAVGVKKCSDLHGGPIYIKIPAPKVWNWSCAIKGFKQAISWYKDRYRAQEDTLDLLRRTEKALREKIREVGEEAREHKGETVRLRGQLESKIEDFEHAVARLNYEGRGEEARDRTVVCNPRKQGKKGLYGRIRKVLQKYGVDFGDIVVAHAIAPTRLVCLQEWAEMAAGLETRVEELEGEAQDNKPRGVAINILEGEIAGLNNTCACLESRNQVLETECKKLADTATRLDDRIKDLEAQLSLTGATVTMGQTVISRAGSKIQILEETLVERDNTTKQLREARQARINELSELKAKITSLESGATGTGAWRVQTGENYVHITRPGGFPGKEGSA